MAARRRPLTLSRLFPDSRVHPLAWVGEPLKPATPADGLGPLLQIKRFPRAKDSQDWLEMTRRWLESIAEPNHGALQAMECLAWAHALPRLATRLPRDAWRDLFASLWHLAEDASRVSLSTSEQPDAVVSQQQLAGELPLTLAYWFPRSEACRALAAAACAVLSEGLLELLDGEGLPHARYAANWRALLACWTRCIALDRRLPGSGLTKDARLQFEWLVRQTMRWRRADGSLMLDDMTRPSLPTDELLAAALTQGGDRIDRELWKCSRGRMKPARSRYLLPLPGEHSEWGELAVLRSSWSRNASYLAATFTGGRLRTELGSGRALFWSGLEMPAIRVNDQLLAADSEWHELCWSSDDDMDYLELELELQDGWLVQRQMLLVRDDRVLLTADAVVGPQSGKIDYQRQLPLLDETHLVTEPETVEVHLRRKHRQCCAMPLALCEWRGQTHSGRFDDGKLHQWTAGRTLYAPLWIDLDPKRRRRPRTWRQLTVGFRLRPVARDAAVAYRVQIGDQQWVVYRSLAAPEPRTFLGQHVSSEFVVGRFTEDGEMDNLVEVEAS